MTSFQNSLQSQFTQEPYLLQWFQHRARFIAWPDEPEDRWGPLVLKSLRHWLGNLPDPHPILNRQENFLFQHWKTLPINNADFAKQMKTTHQFLHQIYPAHSREWDFLCQPDRKKMESLEKLWKTLSAERIQENRNRILAQELPLFHHKIIQRLSQFLATEKIIHSVFSQADLGWDLETGDWENLELSALLNTAANWEKDREIQRIAELLGRDYRSRSRDSQEPPPPQLFYEPGKTEISGVSLGNKIEDALTLEQALLASDQTALLFFQKASEGHLFSWDYQTSTPTPTKDLDQAPQAQDKNERGPMILILDTSGSMRGKPEEVAKTVVLALTKIALEENRRCFLINFSAQVKTLEVSNLKENLKDLLAFLAFSFHGGTDLPPAVREGLKMLRTQSYKEADVLVISDFAVPKIPAPLRQEIRFHQDHRGSRFYALTVSARPLNDVLNVFDAAWTYNIHHNQKPGIDPQTITTLG